MIVRLFENNAYSEKVHSCFEKGWCIEKEQKSITVIVRRCDNHKAPLLGGILVHSIWNLVRAYFAL